MIGYLITCFLYVLFIMPLSFFWSTHAFCGFCGLLVLKPSRFWLRKKYIEACTPEFVWIVKDRLALMIVTYLVFSIVYCFHSVESIPFPGTIAKLETILSKHAAKALLTFVFVAHIAEALFVAYKCQTVFNLPFNVTAKWFIIVFCCGYPCFFRFQSISSFVSQKNYWKKDLMNYYKKMWKKFSIY